MIAYVVGELVLVDVSLNSICSLIIFYVFYRMLLLFFVTDGFHNVGALFSI